MAFVKVCFFFSASEELNFFVVIKTPI